MSQEYTPVSWQDETTSQQGTLINAERLNQMQTAHHYADGFEEVDEIPTEDPGTAYHKIVYCTEDSAFYRWDGTQWTADIDEDTKRLLDQEIARATQAEGELAQDIEDEATARAQADTALGARIDAETEAREDADRQISEDIGRLNGETLPLYRSSSTPTIQNAIAANEGNITNLTNTVEGLAVTKADSDNVVNSINGSKGVVTLYADDILRGAGQVSVDYCITDLYALIHQDYGELQASKADKATTLAGYGITDAYTKTETDTLLATKAPTTALTDGSVTKVGTADLGTDTKPIKLVAGVPTAVGHDLVTTDTAQDISEAKTFTQTPFIKTTYGTIGGGSPLWANALLFRDNDNKSIVSVSPYIVGDDNSQIRLLAYNKVQGSQRIVLDSSGYVTIPNRAYNASNTTDAVNLALLDAYPSMVRTSGNQNISGEKKFSSGLFTVGNSNNKRVDVQSNQLEYNVTPSSTENSPLIAFTDKNGSWLSYLFVQRRTTGKTAVVLWVRNTDGTNKQITLIEADN